MPIEFRCSDCKKPLRAPDKAAGKAMTCKACGTKNRIPAPRKKPARAPVKKPAGGVDEPVLSGDLAKEDARFTVCQKCGEQYLGDEPECPYCGFDQETGRYTKEAKRRELKKQGRLDKTEYFDVAKGEAASFVFRHAKLSARSGLFVLLPGIATILCGFLMIYNGKTPPKMFFGFLMCVFALGMIGWPLWLCQYVVRAKLNSEEKFDRVFYDFFQCCAEGVSFLSLQVTWLFPAMLAMVGAYLYGEDQHAVGLSLMIAGPVLMLPFYPVILSHLAMPVNWPAWLFTKGLQIWADVIAPSFYWVGFTLISMLPGLIMLGVAFGVFSQEINTFVADTDYNAKLAYEQYLADRGEAEAPAGEAREVDFEAIIAPLVITLVALYYIGFASMYPARILGWFALYYRRPLELIQEKKERKYVSRERKIDEDGNVVVTSSGPPTVVIRLGGTVLFYVVANVITYFSTGGEYIILPRPVAVALGLFAD